MIYLDTHIIIWLYSSGNAKLSKTAQNLIAQHDTCISPTVYLELVYMFKTTRVSKPPAGVISYLANKMILAVRDVAFQTLSVRAETIQWTRDPFDRLIAAQASLESTVLLTKGETILQNYPDARW